MALGGQKQGVKGVSSSPIPSITAASRFNGVIKAAFAAEPCGCKALSRLSRKSAVIVNGRFF